MIVTELVLKQPLEVSPPRHESVLQAVRVTPMLRWGHRTGCVSCVGDPGHNLHTLQFGTCKCACHRYPDRGIEVWLACGCHANVAQALDREPPQVGDPWLCSHSHVPDGTAFDLCYQGMHLQRCGEVPLYGTCPTGRHPHLILSFGDPVRWRELRRCPRASEHGVAAGVPCKPMEAPDA